MIQAAAPRLILASTSAARAAVLRAAGLRFRIEPSTIDEAPIKRAARDAGQDAAEAALSLAEAKAREISLRDPGSMVIGADQILTCAGRWFDKPPDLSQARASLKALRGRTHELATAIACLHGGRTIWRHVETPALQMRAFSDAWLDAYLAQEGDALLGSVGAYRIEGAGIQCFTAIAGEHTAILGLPMPALLGFLRDQGVLQA